MTRNGEKTMEGAYDNHCHNNDGGTKSKTETNNHSTHTVTSTSTMKLNNRPPGPCSLQGNHVLVRRGALREVNRHNDGTLVYDEKNERTNERNKREERRNRQAHTQRRQADWREETRDTRQGKQSSSLRRFLFDVGRGEE